MQCARLLPLAAGVLFSVTALQTGPMLTGLIPPSGKEVTVPLFEVARVAPDGRFVETWSSLDKVRVLGQARRARRAPRALAPRALAPRATFAPLRPRRSSWSLRRRACLTA